VLRLEATVAPAAGVDVTAFVDQVQLIDALTGLTIAVPNAGFETSNALSNGTYGYNPTGASWTFTSNSGIAGNGSDFGIGTAPEGTRVAFLQTTSTGAGAFSQALPTLVPGRYRLRLRLRQRGTAATQGVRVRVNGEEVATITLSISTYATVTTNPFRVAPRSPSSFFVNGPVQRDGRGPLRLGTYAAPVVVDVDGDGKPDMLVGSAAGAVAHFEYDVSGLWVQQGQGILTVDGTGALFVNKQAAPTVADLDADGLIDLLVGADDGTVTRFEQNAPGGASFGDLGPLITNGTASLSVGGLADPVVTDVDGDGLLDLLVGNNLGNIYRFEQTTANGAVFGSLGLVTTNGTAAIDVGDFAAPTIADVDGDGLLDMLVGESNGKVIRYEQT
jgi:hypothetical protein